MMDPDTERRGEASTLPLPESVDGRPAGGWPESGEGASPFLMLDGFSGPLDRLLTLARAQKVDLAHISLTVLVDQLTVALQQAPATTSIGYKGDWVVMAAWLVQLRARLLLPADLPAQQDATAAARILRERLVGLQETQALANWLTRRPQLGHEVFTCGQPKSSNVSIEAAPAVDVIEFLWASLALFDDDMDTPGTATVYQPSHYFELYDLAEARNRILQRLGETPGGGPLERFLPDLPEDVGSESRRGLRRRSAWSSTLLAGLELARQGSVVLRQDDSFQNIHLAHATVLP